MPASEAERRAVFEQLERVLASPLFSNSKRYPALLRYVVEESLNGRADNLKERTLGIEVFKWDSHYDTNIDPVVRVTAGEVRKRLAQYYYEAGHETEIHIELPSGSYVPEYRNPESHRGGLNEHPHLAGAATEPGEYQAPLFQEAIILPAVPAPTVPRSAARPPALDRRQPARGKRLLEVFQRRQYESSGRLKVQFENDFRQGFQGAHKSNGCRTMRPAGPILSIS